MTSGTSECGSSGLVLAQKEQKIFIEKTYASLAKEMAAGSGENLYSLAGLLGCPMEQVGEFGAFTQEKYTSIFKNVDTTPTEVLAALKGELSANQTFATSCHRI